MIELLRNITFFIVALSVLVAFHEFGHFWVARKCGVIVQRFAIGFGKVLWRRVGKDGCEYVICAIPLGGYVKMLDERVEDVPENLAHGAFNRKPVLARIAIVAAGPLANFIFAIFALALMYMIGVSTIKPIVGEVKKDSIAAQVNLAAGDQIKSINGKTVAHWQDVNHAIVGLIGSNTATIGYGPVGSEVMKTKSIDLANWQFDPQKQSSLNSWGIVPYRSKATLTVAQVTEGSAAKEAGLQQGDVLIAANGEKINSWQSFAILIQQSHGTSIDLLYQRNTKQHTTALFPRLKEDSEGNKIGFAGIAPYGEPIPKDYQLTLEYGPIDAIVVGAQKTWDLTLLSFNMIGKLITGDLSVKNLSGPISIAQGAGQSAAYGIVAFLSFLALISVNLGIFNLLPLPVLDGGHLMYYFIELLTGKPVPEKIQDVGFRIGGALLLMLMSIAIFNDFTRL
ncbi:sigma E protease regulator RseP [Psychrobium sp. MM17-31]|uniref:sigma E protease regulator RseP n=1 Tax=Psychrobium sp. MM17-31 TaxID=2917758 RepID=UPI001EF6CFC6|nr:sigma E protease regulator RseP [Psychrobium sp. MM17-31]